MATEYAFPDSAAKNADAAAMPDLGRREFWMLSAIGAGVLWMGVYPESFIAPMRADIAALDARLARARPAGDAQLTAGKPQAAAQSHEPAAAHTKGAH